MQVSFVVHLQTYTACMYTHTCMLYHDYHISPSDMYTNVYFTLQADDLDEQLAKTNSNYPYIAIVQMDYSVFSYRGRSSMSNKISF